MKQQGFRFMLKGKTVLVAGGSSGIGLAVADIAYRNGACVIIASRNAGENRKRITDSIGEAVELYPLDISSDESISGLVKKISQLDHLVITVRPDIQSSLFMEIDTAEAKRLFDTKFWGTYSLVRALSPIITVQGSIVLTTGIAGEKIYKGASVMAIANSALETLCRSLALELAPLRVNAVSPGFVEPKPIKVMEYAGQFPAGRLACVSEVAEAYLYLMTSPYVTGTTLVVDGGARIV